jgi:hypothetical protein
MKFKDLEFTSTGKGSIQATHFFPNGYGVSVIRGVGTYGSEAGLYEIGIARGGPNGWELCYSTECSVELGGDCVVGWLDESGVEEWMDKVEGLKE